jgi:hypothetical protein
MDNTANIFISYAPKDEKLAEQLKYFLRPLEMQGLATVWSDNKITGGVNREDEIKKHLNAAQIILLLISPDYLTSNSLMNNEIGKVLAEKTKAHEAQVIPILLRPTYLEATPLEALASLPDGKPVTQWSNRDMAFLNIAKSIRDIINNLEVKTPSSVIKVQERPQGLLESLASYNSESLAPYSDKFQELTDKLRTVNNYLRSYKEKLLVADDPKQKYTIQQSIETLESDFSDLIGQYNELRKKLKLQPLSIDEIRELLSTL